jgi:hypothetical protein
MGAAVQGFGSVFSEELVYNDEGQLMVGSLADYLVPLASDYPVVRCHSLESYPSPTNPLGAKGAGEGRLASGVLLKATRIKDQRVLLRAEKEVVREAPQMAQPSTISAPRPATSSTLDAFAAAAPFGARGSATARRGGPETLRRAAASAACNAFATKAATTFRCTAIAAGAPSGLRRLWRPAQTATDETARFTTRGVDRATSEIWPWHRPSSRGGRRGC